MRQFDVRWVRLAVVAGAIVGSALVSSVATATDESPSIDELVLVVEPAATDQVPPDPPVTDQTDSSSIGIEQPVAEVIGVAPPLDDIVVIEILAAEPDVIEPPVADEVDGATPDGETELGEPGVVLRSAALSDATVNPAASDTGHEGGSGGQGNPNQVTFSVTWLDQAGVTIGVLDAVLPADWRAVFKLSATSQTGQGMPTSATCTYPAGSEVLLCEFDNSGHSSSGDGLIVPARPTATYTVTVNWPATNWTIDGANGGPYSARDTCPRGGGGHEGGEGGSVACQHSVVMRQIATVVAPTQPPAPPVVEPEVVEVPPVVTVPIATVPAAAPAAESAVAAPSRLAATGGSFSMILVIAGLLVAVGSAAAGLTRRTS